MFKADFRDLKRLTRELRVAKESALPYAVRTSLTRSAAATRKIWQQEIRDDFTVRNQFVPRSILFEKAKGTKLASMVARVGSTAPFMDKQEKGGVFRKGKHKPIPTSYAAGQQGASPRTRTVRRANYLGAIKATQGKGLSKKQRNAMAIAQARRSGNKAAILETDHGKGLFRILGKKKRRTRRAMKRQGKGSKDIKMLWDLSRSSVRVKPTPTLKRSLSLMQFRMVQIHREALIEQLRRHKVLGF